MFFDRLFLFPLCSSFGGVFITVSSLKDEYSEILKKNKCLILCAEQSCCLLEPYQEEMFFFVVKGCVEAICLVLCSSPLL